MAETGLPSLNLKGILGASEQNRSDSESICFSLGGSKGSQRTLLCKCGIVQPGALAHGGGGGGIAAPQGDVRVDHWGARQKGGHAQTPVVPLPQLAAIAPAPEEDRPRAGNGGGVVVAAGHRHNAHAHQRRDRVEAAAIEAIPQTQLAKDIVACIPRGKGQG